MAEIIYLIGDATRPRGEGKKILCHVVNNKSRWGKGFVLPPGERGGV